MLAKATFPFEKTRGNAKIAKIRAVLISKKIKSNDKRESAIAKGTFNVNDK